MPVKLILVPEVDATGVPSVKTGTAVHVGAPAPAEVST